jgi:DNA invertase Pin-like site-specific DNA recombinase
MLLLLWLSVLVHRRAREAMPISGDVGPQDVDHAMVRAAQYVRMSTEHQRYSTENQAEVIRVYAERRSLSIVRTYADEGKSGLSLDGRHALRQLIDDVRNRVADFSVILVYDVSRWGRFQDADESAYYEYICKEAGITVQYCPEQFENDGSVSATIIKSMKRAMAGEYSRELSAKVFAGQCRLITLGFRQGGMAGFGLRRQLVDERSEPKALLALGEKKSLQTDRVVLVPGPPDEIATVRRMYRLFVERSMPEREIAALLNSEGLTTDLGKPWTRGTVHQVLANEKYAGHNVYNRVSFKLKKKRVRNDPDTWIRADNAFEALVDLETFELAQRIIQQRSVRYSDEEMLNRLGALFRDRGWLSGLVIDENDEMPSSSAYRSRFGSLLRAYSLVGYMPRRDYRYLETNRFLRELPPQSVTEAIAAIEKEGGLVARDQATDLLTINGEFTASIVVVRCQETSAGSRRWKVRFDAGLDPDISVVLRMDAGNREVMDYYLLPRIDLPADRIRLSEDNGLYLDSYRFQTLDRFFDLAARIPLRSVA